MTTSTQAVVDLALAHETNVYFLPIPEPQKANLVDTGAEYYSVFSETFWNRFHGIRTVVLFLAGGGVISRETIDTIHKIPFSSSIAKLKPGFVR